MNNGFSMLSILNGVSRTLNIANQLIPLYKQVKPIINNSSKILSNIKGLNFNTNKSVNGGDENTKKIVQSNTNTKRVYSYSSPTFFQ